MPNTYTLISSNVLSSSAASVTFSAIPSTFTDLVVRISARGDVAAASDSIRFSFNGLSSNIISYIRLQGNGSVGASGSGTATSAGWLFYGANGSTATASSFASAELYIPSYTSTANKQLSSFATQETNAAAANMATVASLVQLTSAITSIDITPSSSTNFVSGSSFYLYGIKNS